MIITKKQIFKLMDIASAFVTELGAAQLSEKYASRFITLEILELLKEIRDQQSDVPQEIE